jgi:interleukin enhancer-binding factor 2
MGKNFKKITFCIRTSMMLGSSKTRSVATVHGQINFQPNLPHTPFDLIQCENSFPRAKLAPDDSQLAAALTRRCEVLTPGDHELASTSSLVGKVLAALEGLVISSSTFSAVHVQEAAAVGPHKMGTSLQGHPTADVVAVLRAMPSDDMLSLLCRRVGEAIQKAHPSEGHSAAAVENGFEISSAEASVRVVVTTTQEIISGLDAKVNANVGALQSYLTSIVQARWFEENAYHEHVKMLARLLHDMRARYEGFQALTPWMICLLAQYSVMNNPSRQPLALNVAFRRCLKLLSAGLFLPNSAGITDPCQSGNVSVHSMLTLEQQDKICYTAQSLLRVLCYGGYMHVLGFESEPNIVGESTVWNGVIVTPSDKAFERRDGESME